jgi:hypothetical protein
MVEQRKGAIEEGDEHARRPWMDAEPSRKGRGALGGAGAGDYGQAVAEGEEEWTFLPRLRGQNQCPAQLETAVTALRGLIVR